MPHIAFNGWFWDQPGTGSGQYTRNLIDVFCRADPDLKITLILPESAAIDDVPEGVALERVGLKGRGHWAKLRFEQIQFPQTAGRINADLAHVPYWAGPLRSPIPVVVTVHDLIPLLLPSYQGGLLARTYTGLVAASARGSDAIITDSEASRADILEHLKVDPAQVTAIPLAVSSAFSPTSAGVLDMAIRKKYDLPPEYVLYLGGFDLRKNLNVLLHAFSYVQRGYPIPLVIGGKLPQAITARVFDLPRLIADYGFEEGDVQLIGWVEEADKPALYRLATTAVFPSRYEGFGLPVLEAMASGVPVVVGDTPALAELVGGAGFVVSPDNARELAGAILATITQPNVAADLKNKGLTRAKAFDWGRTAGETRLVYDQVLRSASEH
ncbi:MAG: glycosyltransferase family 4 protein [Chloroflexi bacterium]|nr:glycosyltransferase family 4 protein [Chloroflexota bacterium]